MTLPSDLSKLLGDGENPNGFVSQTGNGTLLNGRGGDGCTYNWGMKPDGARWNDDPRPECQMSDMGMTPAVVVPRGRVMVSGHMRRKPR